MNCHLSAEECQRTGSDRGILQTTLSARNPTILTELQSHIFVVSLCCAHHSEWTSRVGLLRTGQSKSLRLLWRDTVTA